MIGAAPIPGYDPENPIPMRRVRPGDFAFRPATPPATDAVEADQRARKPYTLETGTAAQAVIAARVESAVLGLMLQALGMATNDVGAAVRHGLEAVANPMTGLVVRELVIRRLGHLLAFIEFGCCHGLLDRAGIEAVRDAKLTELCDPASRDGQGRPLAPQPIALGDAPLPCRLDSWTRGDGRLSLLLTDGGVAYGFDLDPAVAAHLVKACLAAFPPIAADLAPPRTVLTTARREGSVATFVFDRKGETTEIDFDWETAREVRTAIDAQFPDAGR